jgi:hypothetical protein
VQTGEHRGAQLEDAMDDENLIDALETQGAVETMSVN